MNTMPDITVLHYRPSEIIAIFNELLSRQSAQTGGRLVCLRGIYMAKNANPHWQFCYDALHDESTQDEMTIRLTHQQRQNLSSGNLVEIIGTLGRNITSKGTIQLILNASRIDIIQEQVVDEDEMSRFALREKKVQQGFKNVDNILEGLIFNDKHPKIALVLASSSITLSDFEAGINAAKVSLEFHEERVNFTHSTEFCDKLKELDKKDFDAIALVRGGGIDPNTDVDIPDVVEATVSLKTPFICAVGHSEEKIFLRQVSDKWTATPQGLGQYFSELVESVSEKKMKSRAVLTEQIKKQFKEQLEKLEKQNKETLDKFIKLTKQQEEAQKLHKQQIEAAQKQNKETQEKFDKLTKQQDAAQKQHKEQIEAAQKQNKSLQEQLKTIQKGHEEQLKKLGESHKSELAKLGETHKTQLNKLNDTLIKQQERQKKQQEESDKRATELNKTLTQITNHNAQLNKDLLASQKQLAEAKASKGSYNVFLLVLVAVLFIIIVILLLTR